MNCNTLLSFLSRHSRVPVFACFLEELEALPSLCDSHCIVLFSTTQEQTSHWTVLYAQGADAIYFDSLAEEIPSSLERLLEGSFANWSHLTTPLQSGESESCGYFCAFCVYYLLQGGGLETTLGLLTDNAQTNEQIISQFASRILETPGVSAFTTH